MIRFRLSHTFLLAVIPLLATVAAETVPSGRESVGTQPRQGTRDGRQYLARCVEELDLSACKRVGKRGFSPKERSQGFAYEYAAQSSGPVTALDQAIRFDPQNALAYFLRGHITANDQGVALISTGH